jgi:RNA polymerase sigma-70 factor (ECF subfamily)
VREEEHASSEIDVSPEALASAPPEDAFDPRALRALQGDESSLRELWTEHRRWVAAILIAHKPRWCDVEDLLQDVALSFVRHAKEIRDPRALKPWLRTVALNVAHQAARSGKLRSWATGRQSDDGTHDADARADSRITEPGTQSVEFETGLRLMRLTETIPDGYREPLILKALHDMSYREIGVIMGLPETTVETRITRARRMLRDLAAANDVL